MKRMATARAYYVDRGGNKSFLRDVFLYIFSSGLLACYIDDSRKGKPNCLSLHALALFSDALVEGMSVTLFKVLTAVEDNECVRYLSETGIQTDVMQIILPIFRGPLVQWRKTCTWKERSLSFLFFE